MDINLDWNTSCTLETPSNFMNTHKLPEKHMSTVINARNEIKNVLNGKSHKLIVITGPCSIHDKMSAIEYANLLASIKDQFPNLILVMRAYFEKPRTVLGWKGLIYDPDLDGSDNLAKGLKLSREILIEIVSRGIPVGTEFLDTILPQYYSDLVSWGAIGARTVESQIHRQLTSGLSCPIGFKNSSSGNIKVAVDATLMARHGHAFPGINANGDVCLIKTKGNQGTHVILRGSYNTGSNYSKINEVHTQCKQRNLDTKVIVDCSHGNSNKDFTKQKNVVNFIVNHIKTEGCKAIGGIMLESHIHEGNQKISENLEYGKSITDACINFIETKKHLKSLNDAISEFYKNI